ncbi:hypothetical protein [Streptomyces sp.]|uniref:hypothetical protein n=1 Tax=Streptomyces sp. TaxID=1931 RepID=UPI002D76816B|nr:hypothetical protein [Streptomyces sp.]HET6354848.1 hypothetical protein [Streptomyces sp.]
MAAVLSDPARADAPPGAAAPSPSTTRRTHPLDHHNPRHSASVAAEIGRTDGRASLLLAFNGAVLAGLASVADKELPLPTQVFGALTVLALGATAAQRAAAPAAAAQPRSAPRQRSNTVSARAAGAGSAPGSATS